MEILSLSGPTGLLPCNSSYTESNKRKLFFLTRPHQVKPNKAKKEIRKMEGYSQSGLILPQPKPALETLSVCMSQIATSTYTQPPTSASRHGHELKMWQTKGHFTHCGTQNPASKSSPGKERTTPLPLRKLTALPIKAAFLKLLL